MLRVASLFLFDSEEKREELWSHGDVAGGR